MGLALSVDLRERVIAAIDGGLSCRAAVTRFGVSAASAIRWRQLTLRTGKVMPGRPGRDSRSALIENCSRCLVPGFDGAIFDQGWKDALWARFYTGAPARQRQSVEQYKIVKRA